MTTNAETILQNAARLRRDVGGNLHDKLTEAIYADAGQIAARAVSSEEKSNSKNFEQVFDRLVTSRLFGFPLMILLLTGVFWLSICFFRLSDEPSGKHLSASQWYCAYKPGWQQGCCDPATLSPH